MTQSPLRRLPATDNLDEPGLLRILLDGLPDHIYVKDAEGCYVFSSAGHFEALGAKSPEEVAGKTDFDFYPEELAKRYRTDELEILSTGRPLVDREEPSIDESGNERWHSTTKVPLRDGNGGVVGLVGVTRDVTERKRVIEARQKEEARFRAVFDRAAIGMALVDREGQVAASNRALQEMLGYDDEELRGMHFADVTHPDDVAGDVELFEDLVAGKLDHFRLEKRYFRKDGSMVWGHLTSSAIPKTKGEAWFMIGMVEDITERKRAKEALRESEERYRAVMEQSVEAIYLYDAENKRVLETNHAFQELIGYTEEELLGMTIYDFNGHDKDDVDSNVQRSLGNRGRFVGERNYHRKDGSTITVEISTSVIPYDGKRSLCTVSRDVTERKQAEEALKESEGRFRQLFERSIDALFVHDEEGRIVDCNAEACRSLGYSREELLELSVKDFATDLLSEEEKRAKRGETLWERAMCGEPGKIVGFEENELRRTDGTAFPVEVGVSAIDYGGRRLIFASARDLTERKRAEEALRESEERYRAVMEQSVEAIYLYDAENKRVLETNHAFRRMIGYSEEELLGRRIYDFIDHERENIDANIRRSLEEGQRHIGERRYRRKDGSKILVDTSASVISYGGRTALCAVSRDVTERKEAEEQLKSSEERLAEAQWLAHLGGWEWDVRTDRITWSDEVYRIYGLEPQSVVPSFERFMDIVHPDDRERVRKTIDDALHANGPYDVEHRVVRPDGAVRKVHRRAEVVRGEGGEPLRMIGTVHDITERKILEERLEHRAFHDPLTGLPNRYLFMDRLGQALKRTERRAGSKVAMLFLDLDGFKAINDSLGHEVGDQLLVAVAERLQRYLRPEDTLARFGGDEFVVLLEGIEAPKKGTVQVAERITEGFREPFMVDGRELYVKTSIGVSLRDAQTKSPEDLLRGADTAMYRAKDEGSDYKVFDETMHRRAIDRLELENDLRRAIEQGEFVVHYQPIVNLQTGGLWGLEALVRWDHPEWGLLDPDEFVPLAEESGLVVPMGELVLEEACCRAVEWQREFPRTPPLAMSVNLSGRQLRRPDLHEVIGRALKESGLSASSLGLDITETVYIGALDANTAALDRLKALGIRISLDDFGSGYSSLSYLKQLPADILKIDKSFTKGLGVEIEDTAIVQSIVDLAHILGMDVVGEGVEIEEQETLLKEMGCDMAQGFHFAKPLPPDEVVGFLSG